MRREDRLAFPLETAAGLLDAGDVGALTFDALAEAVEAHLASGAAFETIVERSLVNAFVTMASSAVQGLQRGQGAESTTRPAPISPTQPMETR